MNSLLTRIPVHYHTNLLSLLDEEKAITGKVMQSHLAGLVKQVLLTSTILTQVQASIQEKPRWRVPSWKRNIILHQVRHTPIKSLPKVQ